MPYPWLNKNPIVSMWLTEANRVASSARGQAIAEAKRQGERATRKASEDILKLWTVAASAALSRPTAKRQKAK